MQIINPCYQSYFLKGKNLIVSKLMYRHFESTDFFFLYRLPWSKKWNEKNEDNKNEWRPQTIDVKRKKKVIQKMRKRKDIKKMKSTLECFMFLGKKMWRERHQFSPISCTWHRTYLRFPNKCHNSIELKSDFHFFK